MAVSDLPRIAELPYEERRHMGQLKRRYDEETNKPREEVREVGRDAIAFRTLPPHFMFYRRVKNMTMASPYLVDFFCIRADTTGRLYLHRETPLHHVDERIINRESQAVVINTDNGLVLEFPEEFDWQKNAPDVDYDADFQSFNFEPVEYIIVRGEY